MAAGGSILKRNGKIEGFAGLNDSCPLGQGRRALFMARTPKAVLCFLRYFMRSRESACWET